MASCLLLACAARANQADDLAATSPAITLADATTAIDATNGAAAPDSTMPEAGDATPAVPRPVSARVTDWGTRDRRLDEEPELRYLIGATVRSSPDFFGPAERSLSISPVLAMEWGRLRLSTGGGYGLMGHGRYGRRDRGGGLEGMLRATDRFNLSLSLNIDRGRSAAETARLHGVPDVPTTLRARVRARYFLTQRWTGSLALSQDILGKGGGMEADLWFSYEMPLGPATLVTFGMGASAGNAAYMRSQFGVPATPATAAAGFAPYRPRAGLYQTELGADIAHSISRHWVAFGGVRLSQLHGGASRSPLVQRSHGVAVSVGLAWRN